jgi:hypothetical protein
MAKTLYLSSIYRKAVAGWAVACILAAYLLLVHVRLVQWQEKHRVLIRECSITATMCQQSLMRFRDTEARCLRIADHYLAHLKQDAHGCPVPAGLQAAGE